MKKTHYDIIVVGGGFAGVSSAIAAAREGKDVLLIEKYNCLGGEASFNIVIPFMPYWTYDKQTKEKIPLSRGIFEEILTNIRALGGTRKDWDCCFDEEILKLVLNRMLMASGASVLYQTTLVGANMQNGYMKSITVTNVSGTYDISADYFIDATGDGNLATQGGFEYTKGRESDGLCQPMTLSFRIGNVNKDEYEKCKSEINPLYKKLKREGKIKNEREDLLIFKTAFDTELHFNATRVTRLDPTKIEDLTEAELIAREQVFEIFNFLKDNFEAFKNSYISKTGIQIGVRESRQIVGEYTLSKNDIISCKKFDDSIALCNYDIDIHSPDGEGTSHYYFKEGEYYEIPYRCLIPKGSKNLIVAGRCISADHEAQASLRIMPTCAAIGQGAGIGAVVAHDDNVPVNKIDIKKLQEKLILNGAKIH